MSDSALLERLALLQHHAGALDADAPRRGDWMQRAERLARDYLDSVQARPAPARQRSVPVREYPFREEAAPASEVFAHLETCIARDGLRAGSGRLFGFIPGSGMYASALGDYLAAVTNRYTGANFAAPEAARLERDVVKWLAAELGYPPSAAGDLTSGGSIANLTALVCAREAFAIGPPAIADSVVYLTNQAHHCIGKALHILGLDTCVQRHVPHDGGFRLQPEALRQRIRGDRRAGLRPWLIIANAGSTDIGAVDPLDELAAIAREEGLWLHVDGAYGAAFALCDPGRRRLAGIDCGDSLIIDPHKGLFTPFGSGAVLLREGNGLAASLSATGAYMNDASHLADGAAVDSNQQSLELSRHFRGLRLWLPLQLCGVAPFRAALEEKLLLARYAWEQLQEQPGFETLNQPDLSILGLRALPGSGDGNAFNRRLLEEIQQEGEVFLTSTELNGQLVIRLAIMALNTHREDVDVALDRLQWHRRHLQRE